MIQTAKQIAENVLKNPAIAEDLLTLWGLTIVDECIESAETGYDSANNVNVDNKSIQAVKGLI